MECYIEQKHMDKPLRKYPDIRLYLGGNQWPSIQGALDDFCISKSIRRLTISSHQVVLRSILDGLPLLSNKNKHSQGEWMLSIRAYFNFFCLFSVSHLCDTIGCLSKKHIVSKSKETYCSKILWRYFSTSLWVIARKPQPKLLNQCLRFRWYFYSR
jgi:hypothetical protein